MPGGSGPNVGGVSARTGIGRVRVLRLQTIDGPHAMAFCPAASTEEVRSAFRRARVARAVIGVSTRCWRVQWRRGKAVAMPSTFLSQANGSHRHGWVSGVSLGRWAVIHVYDSFAGNGLTHWARVRRLHM